MTIDSGDAPERSGNEADSTKPDSGDTSDSNRKKKDMKDTWRELREGKLQFKDGSIGKFVYVPINYQFGTRDGMNDVLDLLGIKTRPDLTFSFTTNRGIAPPPRDTKEKPVDVPSLLETNDTPVEEDEDVEEDDTRVRVRGINLMQGSILEYSSETGEEIKPLGIPPTNYVHAMGEDTHVITPKECKVNSSLKDSIPTRGDSQKSESLENKKSSKRFKQDEPNTILTSSSEGVQEKSSGRSKHKAHGNAVVEDNEESAASKTSSEAAEEKSSDTCEQNEPHETSSDDNGSDIMPPPETSLDVFANKETQKDHIKYITGMVTNLLTAIAEFQNTIFLICEPSAINDFARLACEVAAEFHNTTNTLGLFDIDHTEIEGGTLLYEDEDCKEIDIAAHTKPKGEDLSLLTTPMASQYGYKNGEKKGEQNGEQNEEEKKKEKNAAGGLASEVSHRLIFATKKQKEEFQSAYRLYNPTGHFACGATEEEMKTAVNALKMGWPLFIIEGTGPVADFAKEFYENDTARRSRTLKEREERVKEFENSVEPKRAFYTNDAESEGLALLKYNSGMFSNYDPDAYYVIAQDGTPERKKDSKKSDPMSRIQREKLKITEIMSTAFNTNNEIGGQERDKESINQCDDLVALLRRAKFRYKTQAIVIQLMIRICVLLSIVTTSITLNCVGGDKQGFLDNVDKDVRKGLCRKKQLETIIILSLLLPFIAATVQAIDKTLRPSAKFANLLLTQHRLESEKFKFRTRIGIYDSFEADDPRTIPRSKFTERCSVDIYEQCMNQDFKEGTLKGCFYLSLCEWVSPVLSYCRLIWARVSLICSTSYLFLRCKPMKSWKIGNEVDDLIPRNWLRRFFSRDDDYRAWQAKHFEKNADAYNKKMKKEKDLEAQENIFEYTKLGDHLKVTFEKVGKKMANENTKLKENRKRRDDKKRYSIMPLRTYVELRLIPVQEGFEEILPRYIFWRNINQIIIIGFTALSTLLVSLDKELWVPLSLGVAAAADSFLNFYEYEGKAPVLHTAISELKKVLIEYEGLGILEQRLPKYKQLLIDRSEAAIISYYDFVAEIALNAGRDTPEDEKMIDEQSKKIIKKMKEKTD